MFKKFKTMLFALLLLPLSLCFVACGNNNNNNNNNNNPTPPPPAPSQFTVNLDYNLPEKFSFLKENVSEKVNTTDTFVLPEIDNSYSEYFLGWFEVTSDELFMASEILGSEGDVTSLVAKWNSDFERFFEIGSLTYDFDETEKTAVVSGFDGTSERIVIPQAVSNNGEVYVVSAIKQNAFKNSTVKEVVSYATRLSVEAEAFASSALESIEFESFDAFGASAFENTKVDAVTFASTLETISNGVFKNCENLTVADFSKINNNIDVLPESFFEGCTSLKNVIWNSKFTTIKNMAFKNCASLSDLSFLNSASLATLENNVFDGCASVTEVVVPENITSIGLSIFDKCSALEKISVSRLDYEMVGEDNFSKFYGDLKNTVKEIAIIGNTVTNIPENYFRDYTALKKFVMSDSIVSVGKAFYGATNLEEIVFSANIDAKQFDVYSLSHTAWYKNQTEILVLNSVLIFAPESLEGSVSVPHETQYISKSVFDGNEKIKDVFIPASVKVISDKAFNYCKGLETITFETGSELVEIAQLAFNGCTKLKRINLEVCEKLETIGRNAFYNIGTQDGNAIENFVIPNSVTTIGSGAFASALIENFSIENQKYLAQDGVLYEKNNNGEIVTLLAYPMAKRGFVFDCPQTVTTFESNSFEKCLELSYIKLSSGNLTINRNAFLSITRIVYLLSNSTNVRDNSYNNSLRIYYYLDNAKYNVTKNGDTFEFTLNIDNNEVNTRNKNTYVIFEIDGVNYCLLFEMYVSSGEVVFEKINNISSYIFDSTL